MNQLQRYSIYLTVCLPAIAHAHDGDWGRFLMFIVGMVIGLIIGLVKTFLQPSDSPDSKGWMNTFGTVMVFTIGGAMIGAVIAPLLF